ncbi:hypothetical protein LWI29_013528 [Acer saccharum]|uniref:glucan endo-1,3-beta-D-glucosidase n=1 Tax=Acer saccharum TaxID=4024 RepID=A0AA39TE45_ACESA|nr:hypothetical protein LWI29_013528 [Acer saccharum]
MLIFAFLALLLPSPIVVAPVGVCYGHLANNLPPPTDVINLLQSNGISNVQIFNPDPSTLQSFSDSGIKLMIGVPNEILPYLATGNHTLSLQCIDSIANQTYLFRSKKSYINQVIHKQNLSNHGTQLGSQDYNNHI